MKRESFHRREDFDEQESGFRPGVVGQGPPGVVPGAAGRDERTPNGAGLRADGGKKRIEMLAWAFKARPIVMYAKDEYTALKMMQRVYSFQFFLTSTCNCINILLS